MLIYLDNSGTTKQYEQVTREMIHIMENEYGNPSSIHRLGFSAEKIVKSARSNVASSIGARDDEIIFTSGGTESDYGAILGAAYSKRKRGNRIITTKIEHPAVLETCKKLENEGFEVIYLNVDQNGRIIIHELKSAINEKTILISIMHVNNEVGTIQPIKEISKIIEEYNKENNCEILLHVDAVQSYGKLEISNLGAHLVSISGHKVHGPKGIGALYIKKGINITPIIRGGGQERGMRSGTENVPAIAGFGIAAKIINEDRKEIYSKLKPLKARLVENISVIDNVRWNVSSEVEASPSILNVSFLGIRGEVLLHFLEQEKIYVSTGSACSSNKKGESHVLKAMNLNRKEIEGAIRFSFNQFNTIAEIDIASSKLIEIVNRMKNLKKTR